MIDAATLSKLSDANKDALILSLAAQLDAALKLIAALQARIDDLSKPGKTPDNSSLPPCKGHKANRDGKPKRTGPPERTGPRSGSVGRMGGRSLAAEPSETVSARPAQCAHCQVALLEADQTLHSRYDKTALSPVPFRCPSIGYATGTYGRYARVACADEISVRIDGRTCWNRADPAKVPAMRGIGGKQVAGFQNDQVVIHVIRPSRGAGVVAEVLDGHRPAVWWCLTFVARSRVTPRLGRCAWRTCCATANTLSTPVMRCSRRP